MLALTVRERDTGKLDFHFTLEWAEPPEDDPFFYPRVWDAQDEDEAMEWIGGLTVLSADGKELTFDDGDEYIEALANSFHGTTLYMAQLSESPEDVTGDEAPVLE